METALSMIASGGSGDPGGNQQVPHGEVEQLHLVKVVFEVGRAGEVGRQRGGDRAGVGREEENGIPPLKARRRRGGAGGRYPRLGAAAGI